MEGIGCYILCLVRSIIFYKKISSYFDLSSSRRNGQLPLHDKCRGPRDYVLLLRALVCRTPLPEVPLVEEVLDSRPAGRAPS